MAASRKVELLPQSEADACLLEEAADNGLEVGEAGSIGRGGRWRKVVALAAAVGLVAAVGMVWGRNFSGLATANADGVQEKSSDFTCESMPLDDFWPTAVRDSSSETCPEGRVINICYNNARYSLGGTYGGRVATKLQNTDNFGPGGTVAFAVSLIEVDLPIRKQKLEDKKCDVFEIGSGEEDANGFGTLDNRDVRELQKWALSSPFRIVYGSQGYIQAWGESGDYGPVEGMRRATFEATDLGKVLLGSGPFGSISKYSGGGSWQGTFSTISESACPLLQTDDGKVAAVYDIPTQSVWFADKDLLTKLGGISSYRNMRNDGDRLAGNFHAFVIGMVCNGGPTTCDVPDKDICVTKTPTPTTSPRPLSECEMDMDDFWPTEVAGNDQCGEGRVINICYNKAKYSLDGTYGKRVATKLRNTDNFGPDGTVAYAVNLIELSVPIKKDDLEECDVFELGSAEEDANGFGTLSKDDIGVLKKWALSSPYRIVYGNQGYIQAWGDYGQVEPLRNAKFEATEFGEQYLGSGPFGRISTYKGGGSWQGTFSSISKDACVMLQTDDGKPAAIYDIPTQSIWFADKDMLTSLGGISSFKDIRNERDMLAGNFHAFVIGMVCNGGPVTCDVKDTIEVCTTTTTTTVGATTKSLCFAMGEIGATCPWKSGSSCGQDNQLYLDNGERFTEATMDTAIEICGPICMADPRCKGFNYRVGKCFYRKCVNMECDECKDIGEVLYKQPDVGCFSIC